MFEKNMRKRRETPEQKRAREKRMEERRKERKGQVEEIKVVERDGGSQRRMPEETQAERKAREKRMEETRKRVDELRKKLGRPRRER